MIILAVRTDKPEAELYVYKDQTIFKTIKWLAHLKLAETLNTKIEEILNKSSISYNDLDGIIIFQGPGSFTGLRIGFSEANALAYSLEIPILESGGDDWLNIGIKNIIEGKGKKIATPVYGSPAHITKPKK